MSKKVSVYRSVRWAHAVNSKVRLREALDDDNYDMLEADVSMGSDGEVWVDTLDLIQCCCSVLRWPCQVIQLIAEILYLILQ